MNDEEIVSVVHQLRRYFDARKNGELKQLMGLVDLLVIQYQNERHRRVFLLGEMKKSENSGTISAHWGNCHNYSFEMAQRAVRENDVTYAVKGFVGFIISCSPLTTDAQVCLAILLDSFDRTGFANTEIVCLMEDLYQGANEFRIEGLNGFILNTPTPPPFKTTGSDGSFRYIISYM